MKSCEREGTASPRAVCRERRRTGSSPVFFFFFFFPGSLSPFPFYFSTKGQRKGSRASRKEPADSWQSFPFSLGHGRPLAQATLAHLAPAA